MAKKQPVGTWVALGALALALTLDLRIAVRGNSPLASAALMASARTVVLAQQHPGDRLVHSPLLSVSELQHLAGLPTRPDLPSVKVRSSHRVLVLDRADAPMGGLGQANLELPIEPDASRSGPPLVVRIFEASGHQGAVLFELAGSLGAVHLQIHRPAGTLTTECTQVRSGGGWNCPGEAEWLYAAPVSIIVSGQSSPCVWAHPTNGGAVVLILPPQPPPPLGRHLELGLTAALSDDAAATPDGTPVRTEVIEHNVVQGTLTVSNRPGWNRLTLRLEPDQPISLRVTSERDGRRHHCLNAEIREVVGP